MTKEDFEGLLISEKLRGRKITKPFEHVHHLIVDNPIVHANLLRIYIAQRMISFEATNFSTAYKIKKYLNDRHQVVCELDNNNIGDGKLTIRIRGSYDKLTTALNFLL